jgi:glycosyltransferase involved in cell wall biosynthesis
LDRLTIIIPYRDERAALTRLLDSLPAGLPAIVVDDCSEVPPRVERPDTRVIRREQRGYFSGAVNTGLGACHTDVLVLNQDVWFEGDGWLAEVAELRERYALFGQGVSSHPAWPMGYVDGRLMFMRRDAINKVGLLNERDWPLWGATCEWQLRACRAGLAAKPLPRCDWYRHERRGNYGRSIRRLLREQPERNRLWVRTPPLISVVIAAHNHGRYLPDTINSLIGGPTCLGAHPGQTLQGFEVIVVDDASTDETPQVMADLANPWRGVRYIRRKANGGTPAANNEGIRAAYGRYIMTMDADDMLEPGALEAAYRIVERDPHRVPYSDMRILAHGERGRRLQVREYDFEKLLWRNMVPCGILFAKEAWETVGGYPEAFRHGRQDWSFAVALGAAGYCGVRIPEALYLYRREGQNRSLRNTTPQWRLRFLMQMQRAFPALYRGERSMACCGRSPSKAAAKRTSAAPVADADNMVLLEYVGLNSGKTSWFGPSGRRYVFGGSARIGYVLAEDAEALLEMSRDRRPAFRLYTPPAPAPEPAPEPEPAPPDVAGLSVTELREAVKDAPPETVRAWLTQEQAGRQRSSALRILQGALDV